MPICSCPDVERLRQALREARIGLAMWKMDTKFIDDLVGVASVSERQKISNAQGGGPVMVRRFESDTVQP